jgi:hypothetical protein
MPYIFVLLVAVTSWIGVAVGPALAQDGPSICHYHDGTLLNVRQWECGAPPWPNRN